MLTHSLNQVCTNDKVIRTAFREKLEDTCSGEIIDELGVIHGSARVDLAVVGNILHGFELKSDLDTLERLPEQMEAYNSVFDQVTLVVGKTHVHEAIKMIPEWWGVVIAKACGSEGQVNFIQIREASDNTAKDSVSLARLLWREEALEILEKNGYADGVRSKTKNVIYQRLATVIPPATLSGEVRRCLTSRSNWRAARQHTPSGD